MFAAGFETVSTALSFCLYELALKPHIQDRVREEITSKLSENNGAINNDFLVDLNYLDMVLAGNNVHIIHFLILNYRTTVFIPTLYYIPGLWNVMFSLEKS